MKLKKKVKVILIVLTIIIILGVVGVIAIPMLSKNPKKEETVKVINEVEKYGYQLKETKTKRYKTMFDELKKILQSETLDEEKYVSKITEMFIYDFYSLEDKTAKTDVGGVDFVYKPALENFLVNAQDTFYKYVESNIYGDRKQELPVVDTITIDAITNRPYAYGEKNDEKAYVVKANWTYTKEQFATYQKSAQLVFIHEDKKLSLVEIK